MSNTSSSSNHIAADAAVLVRSQVAVVAVCERHSELTCDLHFEFVHRFLCFRKT